MRIYSACSQYSSGLYSLMILRHICQLKIQMKSNGWIEWIESSVHLLNISWTWRTLFAVAALQLNGKSFRKIKNVVTGSPYLLKLAILWPESAPFTFAGEWVVFVMIEMTNSGSYIRRSSRVIRRKYTYRLRRCCRCIPLLVIFECIDVNHGIKLWTFLTMQQPILDRDVYHEKTIRTFSLRLCMWHIVYAQTL